MFVELLDREKLQCCYPEIPDFHGSAKGPWMLYIRAPVKGQAPEMNFVNDALSQCMVQGTVPPRQSKRSSEIMHFGMPAASDVVEKERSFSGDVGS